MAIGGKAREWRNLLTHQPTAARNGLGGQRNAKLLMPRTLVIADLHHHIETADAILADEAWDRAVFLGDYFDDFDDSPHDAIATALWVKERLADPRCTLLFGNHDLPYAWPGNPHLERPGFTEEKALAVRGILSRAEHWSQLRVFTHVGPWLASHAGFSRGLLPEEVLRDPTALEARCATALATVAAGEVDPLFLAGRDRGGRQPVGGVTWCDIRRFQPTAGIHQLVGHTPDQRRSLRAVETTGSLNFCLDHRNGHAYALVDEHHTKLMLWSLRGSQCLREVHHPAGSSERLDFPDSLPRATTPLP